MDTEERISVLEDHVASMRADVAVIVVNYVTKADHEKLRNEVQEVRRDLKGDIRDTQHQIREGRLETKSDIDQLRAEFRKDLYLLSWRIFGFGVVLVGAVHGVTKLGY
ncbi:MAG: hypothetical protein ABIT83_18275 [Massilia sp.]